MSKELEALERIKNAPTIYVGCASDIYTKYSFECKEIEKALKALEIIKKELTLSVKEDNGLYRLITYQSDNHLLKMEQYDLLKEVLP